MSGITLKRVARISAWLLLAAIVLSVVSGWGITRTEIIYTASFGLVDRGVANAVHRGLQIPMAAIFLVHVLVNIRLNLSRRRTRTMSVVLAAIGVALLIAVVLMERYQ